MTETTTNLERSIAEVIREGRKPTGELFQLARQAARLTRSVKVAEAWVDSAMDAEVPDAMLAKAETLHDELEEELARVSFRMEVISEKQVEKAVNKERPEEERVGEASVDAVGRASCLSRTLQDAYNVLAEAPEDVFGVGEREAAPRTRYSLMGALVAAREAADEDLERLVLESK